MRRRVDGRELGSTVGGPGSLLITQSMDMRKKLPKAAPSLSETSSKGGKPTIVLGSKAQRERGSNSALASNIAIGTDTLKRDDRKKKTLGLVVERSEW